MLGCGIAKESGGQDASRKRGQTRLSRLQLPVGLEEGVGSPYRGILIVEPRYSAA